jgi:hypothetical protein
MFNDRPSFSRLRKREGTLQAPYSLGKLVISDAHECLKAAIDAGLQVELTAPSRASSFVVDGPKTNC